MKLRISPTVWIHEMNINFIIISVLVSVICVLLSLVQHYYLCYIKATSVNQHVPVFEDLIPTDVDHEQAPIRIEPESDHNELEKVEVEILSNLQAALASQIRGTSDKYALGPPINYICSEKVIDSEVHNTLTAALAFKLAGKHAKAMKLFEHAAAIAPNNPDVLIRYGEFIEQMHKDVVSADGLYLKALTQAPGHKVALMNRERTAPVVDILDYQLFKVIDEQRDMLRKMQEAYPHFDNVKKQAYYLHIYHTVGIEGNTATVDEVRYLLSTGKVITGRSIIEHNEILGLQLAMKYVKLLVRFPKIEVKEILGIHRRVMGHVDPIQSGTFRERQVYVGKHIPPAPEEVPGLMQWYVEWLNSEEALTMHPVRYAALAHYKLVDIHPFLDGNGRTSRLIMNLILLRAGYPPVIILKELRQDYYDNLNIANQGDVRPFVRFVAGCTEQNLYMYIWGIKRYTELNGEPTLEAAGDTNLHENNVLFSE